MKIPKSTKSICAVASLLFVATISAAFADDGWPPEITKSTTTITITVPPPPPTK